VETIYTVHQRDIKLKSINSFINLWFFGDVHRDATGCDVERWKWFLKRAGEDDPDHTYYMGMGDYHDLASAGERQHLNRDSLHETTMETLDELVIKRNREFCKEIKQMNGKLLGLLDGNHNWRFPNGITASEDLSNRMGCDHLGWLCHYTLTFKIGSKSQNVHIVACHGRAGGKRIGTSINQVEDMKVIFPLADIYVMGHNHDRGAWPVDVLYASGRKGGVSIKQKRQFLCRSGSFLKAYEKGRSNYATGRLLRPADLGSLKLTIGFHRDYEDGDRVITDIEAVI
jgi:hypothetical protein